MQLHLTADSLALTLRGAPLLAFDNAAPAVYVGRGEETVEMYRGNYRIEDYVTARIPLQLTAVTPTADGCTAQFGEALQMELRLQGACCTLRFSASDPTINRFWLRVCADEAEHCYGCGEQMSYFDLRGRHFPLWTSEPGVGRDKSTYVTWRSDVENKAGGDYYNTNYPQPTFVSSRRYYLHADASAYADFDFRHPSYHELQFWEIPREIRIEAAESFPALLEKETAFLGRQPVLPGWVGNGLILGLQGGRERTQTLLERTLAHGIKVAAVWCQDWCGKRVTSFGKRLQWDWQFHPEMYPDLPGFISELHARGIRFMGYVNPYLVKDGALFREGLARDVFARRQDGSVYLVDFGEFDCGVVDLTKPAAFEWFKNDVIKAHSLAIGIDGWMADFGEYLPTDDLVLDNGVSPMLEHNRWPVRWAKCNYEALAESGKLGDCLYFMRAGGTGSQRYCTMLWAGDQSVDFSIHDGLGTTICAALSAGMSGCGLSHSDIGGYTSLFGNVRTKELFLRWAEMAAFTPMMRTHECNRPEENFQYYDDDDCMTQLARLVDVYTMLAPYTRAAVEDNAARGLPVQRPMFFCDETDARLYTLQYQYLLGGDLIVAPVYQEAQAQRSVYLPQGEWIHLWTGRRFAKGETEVACPLGQPPVFYRADSAWHTLFEEIGNKHGAPCKE